MSDSQYQRDLQLFERFNEAFDRFMLGEHDQDDLRLIDSYPYPAKKPVQPTELEPWERADDGERQAEIAENEYKRRREEA